MVEIVNKIPGLDYEIKGGDPCVLCHRPDVPVLVSRVSPSALGICESCAVLAEWAFRRAAGEVLPSYPAKDVTKIDVALVLVVKVDEWKREGSTFYKPSVLMIERTEDRGQIERTEGSSALSSSFSLPGGAVMAGEKPEEAARRWLVAQTSCVSWPLALETLHTGLSLRGKLVRVYLARAWAGEANSGQPTANSKQPTANSGQPSDPAVGCRLSASWKPLPMVSHAGPGASFLTGVEEAYERRFMAWSKTLAGSTPGASLSVKLRRAAAMFLEKKLLMLSESNKLSDSEKADVESEINAAYYAMNDEEKTITKEVIASLKEKNMAVSMAASAIQKSAEKKVAVEKNAEGGFAREKFVSPSQDSEGAASDE